MSRRGESIYKRKDGRWEARYVKEITADGKKKYGSVYANSYRAVKEKQQLYISEPLIDLQCTPNITVNQLTKLWLRHIKNKVKLATYRKYDGLCTNHILSEIGNIPINRITRSVVESFAENRLSCEKLNRSGELSRKTVNDILTVLGLIFSFAEEEYNINMPKITYLREEKKEARVLSVEEHRKLTAFLLEDMDIYKFSVLLALYTGLRIGELSALLWEDVTDSYIVVNKTLQRLKSENGKTEIFIDTPKSHTSKRVVPIPSFLLHYINMFRKKEGYVISTKRSSHTEPRVLQMKFAAIAKQCGLENVTFHTLRHTFATRCIEAGFDVKSLSEILGHSDVKTTLNRYVHSSFELKKSNMEKLEMHI